MVKNKVDSPVLVLGFSVDSHGLNWNEMLAWSPIVSNLLGGLVLVDQPNITANWLVSSCLSMGFS